MKQTVKRPLILLGFGLAVSIIGTAAGVYGISLLGSMAFFAGLCWLAALGLGKITKGGTEVLTKGQRQEDERTAALSARRESVRQSGDLLGVVPSCIWLGGVSDGVPPAEGTPCVLAFGKDNVARLISEEEGEPRVLLEMPLAGATLLLEGPGKVERGGRFSGGGFGIKGAAEGMLAAEVLNRLTRRVSVQTIVMLQGINSEWILATSSETPAELRVTLSGVYVRLRALAQA